MGEETSATSTLNLFAPFRGSLAFWALAPGQRRLQVGWFLEALRKVFPKGWGRVEGYQVFPSRGENDFLIWAAGTAGRPDSVADWFGRFAKATASYREWFEPGETFWGLTRPSPYVRKESSTTIDPIDGERLPYLFVYPFVKTHDWYALEMEERRKLMGEHIQVGRQFGDVNQLLLYAFGLQDQDFVVVYEARDPARFSQLVQELRGTAARAYTARDTPILTAVHRSDEELARLFDD